MDDMDLGVGIVASPIAATQAAPSGHAARAHFPFPSPFGPPQITEMAAGLFTMTVAGSGFTRGGVVDLSSWHVSGTTSFLTAPVEKVVASARSGCSGFACWGPGNFTVTFSTGPKLGCLTNLVTAFDESSGVTVQTPATVIC